MIRDGAIGDLFWVPEAPRLLAVDLAQEGMTRALDRADRTTPQWGERAYDILTQYASINYEFMTEDVRNWAHKLGLPEAPSARAWGAIAIRAARDGIIEKRGYRKTQNPLAHGTPAALWRSLICRDVA